MEFRINTSWDGTELDYNYDIKLRQEGDFVILELDAPYFYGVSPGGEKGEPFPELWKYEVLEAFFVGTDNMYLEVELAPWGQHLVLFLAGERNPIKMLLPMEYTSQVASWKWHGVAKIPIGYFPPSVSLFNAFAIHGQDYGRKYAALYPAPPGRFEDPDFHRLNLFKPIDFDNLVKRDKQLSKEWKEALDAEGIEYDEKLLNSPKKTLEFKIRTDWESNLVDHSGVNIKLRPEGEFVVMEIQSRFYGSPCPKGSGQRFPKLWKKEIVTAFFLGTSTMYLEVECSPHGKYLVILLASSENPIKMDLKMKYTAKITGRHWTGKAKIPVTYFPPLCTLFNAHAVYGHKNDRRIESLYPAERRRYAHPDFHRFHFFKEIDFKMLLRKKQDISLVWKNALKEKGIIYKKDKFYVPDPKKYDTHPLPPDPITLLEMGKFDFP